MVLEHALTRVSHSCIKCSCGQEFIYNDPPANLKPFSTVEFVAAEHLGHTLESDHEMTEKLQEMYEPGDAGYEPVQGELISCSCGEEFTGPKDFEEVNAHINLIIEQNMKVSAL